MSTRLTTNDIAAAIKDALEVQDQVERGDCNMVSIDTYLDRSNVKVIAHTGETFTIIVLSND